MESYTIQLHQNLHEQNKSNYFYYNIPVKTSACKDYISFIQIKPNTEILKNACHGFCIILPTFVSFIYKYNWPQNSLFLTQIIHIFHVNSQTIVSSNLLPLGFSKVFHIKYSVLFNFHQLYQPGRTSSSRLFFERNFQYTQISFSF